MIIEKIREVAEQFPNKSAIIFDDHHVSYSQLKHVTNKLANGLRETGIGSGDRVVLMMPNLPHFVFSYYAILMVGAIVVPFNYMMEDDEFYGVLETINPRAIIYWEGFRHHIRRYLKQTSVRPITIVLGEPQPMDTTDLVQLISQSPADFEPHRLAAGDTALIQYTSGVTEPPKGIELSYENLISSLEGYAKFFRFNSSAVFGVVLPLFFIFSQNALLNSALLYGGTVVLHPRIDYQKIARSIDEYQITVLAGSPNFYKSLLESAGENVSGASLKYCLSSWQPLTRELEANFEQRFGIPLLNCYSITETCGIVASNHPSFERKSGSVGLVLPDVEIHIMDDQGQPLDHNEVGEIAIHGSMVMKDYWNSPDLTARHLRDGWYFTGDLGKIDDEGYLFLINKKAEVILKSGFPIYTSEIEQLLVSHPKVKEAVVIATSHPDHKEDVQACIVLEDNETLTPAEIIEYCRSQVPVYKCPQVIKFYPSLPRTKMGRIFKRKLQENSIIKKPNKM